MTSTSLDELRRSLAGAVLGPGDDGYDAARRCFNALVDRRPAVTRIARADGGATWLDFDSRGLLNDGLEARTFIDQQRMFDSPYGENRHYWKGRFVRELPDELIDALLERIVALGRAPGEVLIESLHGAPKDADADSGPVGFRHAAFDPGNVLHRNQNIPPP